MAVKIKSELDKLTNDELVKYLNSLSKTNFNQFVDADTKVRYFIYIYGEGIAKAIKGTGLFFPAIVAMKITESGYGRNIPTGSFNFGGVKYNPNIHDGFVLVFNNKCKCKYNSKTINIWFRTIIFTLF